MRRTPLNRKTPLGTRKKSKKKLSASWYRDRLDEVCKANIRSLGRCEATGMFGISCSNQLHAHHISRCRHSINRWFEPNFICLCASHHMHIHDHPKDELTLVNTLWDGAEYIVDIGRVSHYDYLMWREHNLPFDKDYESLYEHWKNKAPRS